MASTITDIPTETTPEKPVSELAGKVSSLLNQEKWTRAAINSYVIGNFNELDELIKLADEEDLGDEIREICEIHLNSNRNSIIALYLSGLISIRRRLVDDSSLVLLVNIFTDNHKWNLVEYLCNRMLEFGENRFALRTLADSYDNKNDEASKLEVYERLIRVDYEEAECVKILAQKYEQDGDIETASNYYRKALHRYVNKRNYSNIKEIWDKLVQYQPNDTEFFLQLERKVARTVSEERAVTLLESLYPQYYEKEDWNTTIQILKRILVYEPKNSEARTQIAEAYSEKHAGHSHLEEYLKISNLTQGFRDVQEAISDFEKHIAFDAGNFVFHRTWGIGRISNIDNDEITIDFPKKRNHKMSLKMAVSALKILNKEHFWVKKATTSRDKLRDSIKQNPAETLRIIIKSFNNSADMKRIRLELVPRILSPSEWTKWSTTARRILKTDPSFGSHQENADNFVVRESPISYEEKTYHKFIGEKGFFTRVATLQEYLTNANPDSEFFNEMYAYFTGFLKSYTTVNYQVIASFLLVQSISKKHPYLATEADIRFADLFSLIPDLDLLFTKIDNTELRKDFLIHVRQEVDDWPNLYSRFFFLQPSRILIDPLVQDEKFDSLSKIVLKAFENYRDLRETFIWILKNCENEDWFKKNSIKMDRAITAMVHLLDLTYRDVDNKRDVAFNRKLNKRIFDYLFKDSRLVEFLELKDLEINSYVYSMLNQIENLDPAIKIRIKENIVQHFPEFKVDEEVSTIERKRAGLLVTYRGYEQKQSELRNLIDSEIPANSKEIGLAMQKGDLRENAEYKAALEKQDLLKASASRLQEDLQEAQVFDLSEVDAETVSFGTKVILLNIDSGKNENFTILGPWESDPAKNVISYLSPLGSELWGHKNNDQLQFVINDNVLNYQVESIEAIEDQE